MTHDYKRHGTTTLFAALDVATGELIHECMPRHRHQEFLRFMNEVEKRTDPDLDLHVILDNYATHKHKKVAAWLEANPRVKFHFTPTSASWLNLVERFFSELTQRQLKRLAVNSVKQLTDTITAYIENRNRDPAPFKWTAAAEDILAKVSRANAHFSDNTLADEEAGGWHDMEFGSHGSMVPENGGLTDFGRDVVAELNATRTLVDLSHSGERTLLDAIDASSVPVAITHTGCRAVTDLPRNKTDRELRLVAEGGGIVGIYFMPCLAADGMAVADDVVRHIEHAVQVCGEEHVGIGTDGGTTAVDDLDAAHEAARREVEARRRAGIGAAGERPGVVPFIPDLQGPGQFRKLADMLLAREHSSERVERILGRNALRVMRDVWAA